MNDLLKNEQDVIIHNEKKEQLETVKSLKMFGSSVTHEMRTPLSIISMICRLINSELSKDVIDKAKILTHTEKINNEVRHLFAVADIINDRLRDTAEIEPFVQLSIKDTINNFLSEYKFSNLEKDSVRFECKSDFLIAADRSSFTHILCNFLRSALYNKRPNTQKEIIITAYEEKEHNILSFKSTVSEVDSQMCDSIFDLVMPKKICGTNLGLYLCKKIMDAMKIEVCCELKDNQYIEFILKFPKIIK